jgi:integrase
MLGQLGSKGALNQRLLQLFEKPVVANQVLKVRKPKTMAHNPEANDAPHITRHSAATALITAPNVDLRAAAAYLGMTVEMLWGRYGHHHPDFQSDVAGFNKTA